MNKLINIAKRLSKSVKDKDATDVYFKLKSDRILSQIMKIISAEDFIKVCFLISAQNREIDLEGTLEQINKFLLSFTMVEVSNRDAYESCGWCGGDGQNNCGTCGGDETVNCDSCDGTGEDDDGDTCEYCDGDGQVDCDECGGKGYVACDNCDGDGEVVNDDAVEASIFECITISVNLFNQLETKQEEEIISIELYDLILSDRETIKLYRYDITSENIDTDFKGEYYIHEVNKSDILLAYQGSNNSIRDNFLSDLN